MTLFDLTYPAGTAHARPPHDAELLPVIDEQGRVLDAMTRAEAHGGTMRLHPVVHLHVVARRDGQTALCLQKRSLTKDIQPGRWDTAVGGHVDYGETLAEAVVREAAEEIGLDAQGARLVLQYVWQSERERELVSIFVRAVGDPDALRRLWQERATCRDEVDDLRFWTADELARHMGKGVFTPQLEQELPRVAPLLADALAALPAADEHPA